MSDKTREQVDHAPRSGATPPPNAFRENPVGDCDGCGEYVVRDLATGKQRGVWLELNARTGVWQDPEAIDADDWGDDSQGCFPFHHECARDLLRSGATRTAVERRAFIEVIHTLTRLRNIAIRGVAQPMPPRIAQELRNALVGVVEAVGEVE